MLAAAVVLTVNSGCRGRNREVYPREQARASAPRANLYPMTSPPPGSAQPLQGYAPTRITASYNDGYNGYNNNTYANAGGYNNNAGYNPGYSGQQGGYTNSPVGYNPGGMPGDPFAGTVQNPFTPNGGVCRVEEITAYSNPTVPIKDPPVLVNRVNVTTPYPGYNAGYSNTTASYTTNTATYGGGTPNYIAPTLSATTSYGGSSGFGTAASYGMDGGAYGPYNTSVYGGTSTVGNAPVGSGISYGPVEGTADLVTSPAAIGMGSSYSTGYGMPGTGAGYTTTTTTTRTYSGGAYPRATATIPATYTPAPTQAPVASFGPNEIRLVPAPDVPPGIHPNDAGPSQWFEIIRPGNAAIRIGRVSATCVCVGVRVPKRHIAAGERALVEARIVSRPQVNNLTYGIYVNIAEPVQTVVDADVTISL